MSGGSSANNSWTLLTPEEPVTETLRPLAEGTEHHEVTSATGSAVNKPVSGAESADGLTKEGYQVSEENPAELSGDTSTEQHTSIPTALTDAAAPTALEASYSFAPDNDALSQSEGLPEGPAQPSPDPDSFSDSYTHITPSSDEPPASLLSTETLGGVELAQEGTLYQLNGEGLQHEGLEANLCQRMTDEGKQADSAVESEVGEQKPVKTAEEGEPELRRRRSLLAALERIGKTEEDEEKEEEFQLPQREEHSGLSVNKCILGAVILLGLGTIFFSALHKTFAESDYGTRELKDAEVPGKQEWLNPDSPPPVEVDSTELLNKLAKGNQRISVLQAQLQAQEEELKVAKGQAAEGAKERLQWEEVEKENSRLKKEMASVPVLQKENQRMKRELESVPALQQELETLRATVTELKFSPAASEATQAPVKVMTSPPSGQQEDSTYGTAESTEGWLKKPWKDQREKNKDLKDTKDMGEKERKKSEYKEREKKEHKDGGKPEWKKEKHEQAKFDKEKHDKRKQKRYSDETKQWKDNNWKKEKASRGDEGKLLKDREGNKEWKEKSERKERKGEKDWKRAKHEEGNKDKQWRGKKEKKDWKAGKEHGEKHNGREEWKGEKQWRAEKDGNTGSGKEKEEKKGWKEKGEKQEWKKDGDWKHKNGEDHSKDRKWKGETKQWEESKSHEKDRKGNDEGKHWNKEWKSKSGNSDEEWKRKNERKQWNEWKSETGKYEKDWKRADERKQEEKKEQWKRSGQKDIKDWDKDRSSSHKYKDEHKFTGDHGHKWGGRKPSHTHRHPSLQQPEYWVKQRNRLQHNPKPPQHCDSLETCAQTEGLLPVPLPEFEAILQTYLTRAEEVGVDTSIREELKKLATEFFKDGVFVHDQMSFQDFAEDLGDVLEDMVEGDDYEEEEDSAIEEEMEEFEREVMKRFSLPGAGKKEERPKGEWRKESGRGRG